MSKLFTTILPSLLAGGLLFGSAITGAQPAPAPPAPPAYPHAGHAPKPPKPPKAPKPDKTQIHIDLGNLDEMVDQQIEHAMQAIGNDASIPPHVRQAVKQRLEKVRIKVKHRLAKANPQDLEALGEELGQMGEEIGEEMEKFGEDMEKWGKQFEKQMEKQVELQMKRKDLQKMLAKRGGVTVTFDGDDDDDDDFDSLPDLDDADDLDDAMKDLGSVKLQPDQRAQLRRLRADSDQKVARAKADLDRASDTLRTKLENTSVSEQEISRAIDDVTKAESEIRKARIIAWVNARRLLDDSQRKRVEAAARGRGR